MEAKMPDLNLTVAGTVEHDDVVWCDVRQKPFRIYGLYRPCDEPVFKRLPDEVGLHVSDGVAVLYLETAGGRVRFATDSPYVAVRAELASFHHSPHSTLSGFAGLDLYMDDPTIGTSRFQKAFIPPLTMIDGFESCADLHTERTYRYYTVYFPNYASVRNLFIGVQKGSRVGEGLPYRDLKPIVYYGSSITQGACASRPGNAYENIISRRLNVDHLNLGFSGCGKAEKTIVDHMATLPMSVFVSDYDHNAPTPEYLEATHEPMYRAIRAAHPDIPYIMVSRPDYFENSINVERRREIIMKSYLKGRAEGDKKLRFVDGATLWRGVYEDSCSVDGVHPNDLGLALMADKIGSEIEKALEFNT